MNIEATIAVEGVETTDGRFVEPGALTWWPTLPVYRLTENPTPGGWGRRDLIGSVESVWREGDRVVADLKLHDDHGLTGSVSMCMEIDDIGLTGDDAIDMGARWAVVSGRIRAVTIHQRPTAAVWPECVFVFYPTEEVEEKG